MEQADQSLDLSGDQSVDQSMELVAPEVSIFEEEESNSTPSPNGVVSSLITMWRPKELFMF